MGTHYEGLVKQLRVLRQQLRFPSTAAIHPHAAPTQQSPLPTSPIQPLAAITASSLLVRPCRRAARAPTPAAVTPGTCTAACLAAALTAVAKASSAALRAHHPSRCTFHQSRYPCLALVAGGVAANPRSLS